LRRYSESNSQHPWIVVDSDGRCLEVYHPAPAPRTVLVTAESPKGTSQSAREYRVADVAAGDALVLSAEPDQQSAILRRIADGAQPPCLVTTRSGMLPVRNFL